MDEVQEVKKTNTDAGDAGAENKGDNSESKDAKSDSSALFEEFSNFSFDDMPKMNSSEKKPITDRNPENSEKPISNFRLPTLTIDKADRVKGSESDTRATGNTGSILDRALPLISGFDPSNLPIGQGRGPSFQFPRKMPDRGPGNYYDRDRSPLNPGERPFLQGLGQFLKNPEVQSQIGQVLNRPEVKQGITEVVNSVGSRVGVHIDSQRGEIDLALDFDALYEKSVPKDSPDYNPEAQKMLSHLENVKLSASSVEMKFDSPQLMQLGDKGIAKLYKLNLGADGGRTSMKYETTPTKLTMSEIKGMNVMDPSGKKLAVHSLVLDSTDPKNPAGLVTVDNPVPKPNFLPDSVPWSDTVTVPLLLPEEQKQALVEKLPGTIKTIDAIASGAKSGDLSQTLQKLDLGESIGMLGWGLTNKGSIDLNAVWKQPDLRELLKDRGQPQIDPRSNPGSFDRIRR